MSSKSNNGFSLFKVVWLGILIILLVLSLLVTVGVIALKIGNTLPEGTDILFLVPKNPSYGTSDDQTEWTTDTKIDIFRSEYVNGEAQTTVLSQTGDDIIAPGTVSQYSFCVYNDGNMALACRLNFSFFLLIDDVIKEASAFPLLLRMKKSDGTYVLGSETEYVPLTDGVLTSYESVLGASSYEEYFLELNWAFEGNDELDTALGNAAAKQSVQLQFNINTFAETHSNPAAKGGVIVSDSNVNDDGKIEYGGDIRWELFIPLVLTVIALLVFIVCLL